jgi:hypothetical protein
MENKPSTVSRKRDTAGRFAGPCANVERVPRLPTFAALWVLEDPRRRPYLVFWTSDDGEISWGLKMAPTDDPDAVLLTLEKGRTQRLTIMRRSMPRGPGTVLFYLCPTCQRPRRYLYRLSLSLMGLVDYFGLRCQRCAGLRFRSQGRYMYAVLRWTVEMLHREGERFPRSLWDPRAVSDPRLVAAGAPDAVSALCRTSVQVAGAVHIRRTSLDGRDAAPRRRTVSTVALGSSSGV